MRRTLAAALAVLLVGGIVRAQAGEDYKIGAKDLLAIKVFELPEFNLERRVTESGSIELPLLGQVPVVGMTASEVADSLARMLKAQFVNRANVSVVVKEFQSKPVSVLGAVARPGSLTVAGNWYLLQAISAAGGLSRDAGQNIYVIRRADNNLSDTLELSVEDLFNKNSSLWNVPIYPSDIVNIPAKTTVRVFCLGEVKTPGALEFDGSDRISVLSAIAKAGGLTDRASKTLKVRRRGPDGKDREMVVHFGRIVAGREPDLELKPDDVVIVKVSFL